MQRKYELPLFLVTVKTNVGYTPIADFVVHSETSNQIEEALKIIATWNPPYFMTDFSDAEISAIEAVFPQTARYIYAIFIVNNVESAGSRIRNMDS